MDSPAAPPEKKLTPENERHRAIQRERPREFWSIAETDDGPRIVKHERPNRHERRQRLAGLPRPMRKAIKAANAKASKAAMEAARGVPAVPPAVEPAPVVVEPPASEPAPEPTP